MICLNIRDLYMSGYLHLGIRMKFSEGYSWLLISV
jgi:hypothetical protein